MDPYEELARRAGLFLDHVGRKALERVDLASPTALEQAAEILAVPETWFFRDGEPFVCLARFAASGPRPLRVLSAPCSTGEEPYSIAIALLEAGLAPGEFAIDAVDISAHAIAAAGRAVYGKPSFRQPMPAPIEKYFERTGQGYHVRDEVAGQVRFQQANLLEGLGPARPYHVVFCRNLLIYLHEEARRTVIAVLRGLLADDGLLFAGHSEVAVLMEAGFQKVQHPRSFACRQGSAAPAVAAPAAARRPAPRVPKRPGPKGTPKPPMPAEAEPALDEARRLADRGRLAEAAAVCKRLPPAADVFCLLGLISQALDHLAEAEEYFRRALYLDPAHREALVHMSLLCASRGDTERSAVFRDRAERAPRRLGQTSSRLEVS
jgi:chemotaxis protein methyltransferase WspC